MTAPTPPVPVGLPQLLMRLRSLADIPSVDIPIGFRLKTFEPGDEQAWCDLVNSGIATDPNKRWSLDRCRANLTERPQFSADALFFAMAGSRAVATACAWRNPADDFHTGYVHMVSALPEYRGQGLGRLVTVATLRYFAEHGFSDARLHTDDFRLPAIRTYLRLGFEPAYEHPSHAGRWLTIYSLLEAERPDTPLRAAPFAIGPIGYSRNEVLEPIHSGWAKIESTIEIEPGLEAALDGIVPGVRIQVIFWLDKVNTEQRGIRRVHPKGDESVPLAGVFATRSQYRPNPIGVTEVEVVSVDRNKLRVIGLDTVNGTPILDIKRA